MTLCALPHLPCHSPLLGHTPPYPSLSPRSANLQDVVEVMAPTYTMGLHVVDTSTKWTTSDVMCYLDGF